MLNLLLNAGFCVVSAIALVIAAMEIYLWFQKRRLTKMVGRLMGHEFGHIALQRFADEQGWVVTEHIDLVFIKTQTFTILWDKTKKEASVVP